MTGNTGYTLTLANSIIGVGILAMPFCFQKCGIILSIVLLILSGIITRLTCIYLLKTSIKCRRRNFEFLASYIFGASGKLIVELCIIGYQLGSCIAYYVVVGDLGPSIISKLFDIENSDSLRMAFLTFMTIFCVLPLGLLKDIGSLSHVSAISIIFYFILIIKIMFESEEKLTSSHWTSDIELWRFPGLMQVLPIFSMSLSCQLQIFEIYESLPNQTVEKMNQIIKAAVNICTGVYIMVGLFGYIAFSDQHFTGNILLSFSSTLTNELIKLGFVLSVAFSFPLVIFPCRASLYSLIYHKSHSDTVHYIPEHRFRYVTILIVLVALVIGIMIPSIELVIGIVGSTIGVAICIIFPASCFIRTNKKSSTEKLLAQFLLVFGIVLMILGTYANLEALDRIEEHQQLNNVIEPIQLQRKIVLPKPITENIFTDEKLEPTLKIERIKPISREKKIIPFKEEEKIAHIEPIEKIDDKVDKHKMADEEQKKFNITRRKHLRPMKIDQPITSNVSIQPAPIREINIDNKPKNAPVEPKIPKKNPENAQTAPQAPKEPVNVIEAPKENLENVLNKEAIQKEDQEIAIDAKENKDKNNDQTKKILNEVKNVIEKQNNETKKLFMEKIDKISEKVNKIEKMREAELQRDDLGEEVANAKEQVKNSIENVPIVKLLTDQKANLTQTVDQQSVNEIPENKKKEKLKDDDDKANLKK